jgi:hypothetical protein
VIGDLDLARLRGRHGTIVSPACEGVTTRSFHPGGAAASTHCRYAPEVRSPV